MLTEKLKFNRQLIRSYTLYECFADDKTIEKELSFHVLLSKNIERKGDSFPVYEVPQNKTIWLSDWSFCIGGSPPSFKTFAGGSLGRITRDGNYVYVLNAGTHACNTEIYSPSRPIRYLSGEWIAVCFHHLGELIDISCRATFRFIEVVEPNDKIKTTFSTWSAKTNRELFAE